MRPRPVVATARLLCRGLLLASQKAERKPALDRRLFILAPGFCSLRKAHGTKGVPWLPLLLLQKSPRHKRRAVATTVGRASRQMGISTLLLLSPPRRSPLCLVNCRACSGITVRCGGPLAEACIDVCPGFSLIRYFDPATLSCSSARRAPCEGGERSRAEAAADSR